MIDQKLQKLIDFAKSRNINIDCSEGFMIYRDERLAHVCWDINQAFKIVTNFPKEK